MKEFWDKTWSRNTARYNRHHKEIWEAVLPFLKGKVVDLGCGTCTLYEGKDVDLTGVDFSQEALKRCRERYPSGKYVCADVRATGLPDGAFDTCIIIGVLDYFKDWQPVLAEARRITVLKNPDGVILVGLLNGFEGKDWKTRPPFPIIKEVGNWILMRTQ